MPRYQAIRDCFVANRYVREGQTVDLDAAGGDDCTHLTPLDAPPEPPQSKKAKAA